MYITIDNWRLDAPRSVTLNPAIAGEGKAGKMLSEVFYHIISLKLTMYQ
jgi:hypothetical protein